MMSLIAQWLYCMYLLPLCQAVARVTYPVIGRRLYYNPTEAKAWHINMSNHALNRDDGAYLPEEYMHLIGR